MLKVYGNQELKRKHIRDLKISGSIGVLGWEGGRRRDGIWGGIVL